MKFKTKKIFSPGLLLAVVFILVVSWEIYLLYTRVYANLFAGVEDVRPENIVRLDLRSYNKTLNLLDSTKSFTPKPLNLSNSNPFK